MRIGEEKTAQKYLLLQKQQVFFVSISKKLSRKIFDKYIKNFYNVLLKDK